MKLSEIMKNIEYEFLQGQDINITDIVYDSRKTVKGSLFICISGFVTKGFDYIEEAIKNGATAIIVEKAMALSDDIAIIKVADARYAMAIASANFYHRPSRNINIIGVTGTNGKTTTTFLIGYILKECKHKVGIIGTIENYIGDKVLKSERTTPESLDLQRLFNSMVNENIDDVVMEVSSHSLVLNRVVGCEFEVGIFTNLTQDHLDFHKTMENYRQAKARLFKMCKKGVINIDDPAAKYIADMASCDIITFGIENKADFRAKNVKLSSTGVNFDITIDNEDVNFTVNIPGRFSVYNALGAIAACYSMGISVNIIKEGLKNAKGVLGRCQAIQSKQGFSVVVDYAHTPDGLENIITAVNEFTLGRTIVVFGCGGDRDKTKRPIMGEIAGKLSDFCIITSDNPRSEEPEGILTDIETGILKTQCPYLKIVDRKMAIKYALDMAQKDDVIIVAGKGHENYQIFKDRTIHFDDVEIVKNFLQED
jgi:UDP-N-acetylmuramoyl-L-alanyl-D-glutamate--2,6-diaminopimelate ligase